MTAICIHPLPHMIIAADTSFYVNLCMQRQILEYLWKTEIPKENGRFCDEKQKSPLNPVFSVFAVFLRI
jgi:hypothetical protein